MKWLNYKKIMGLLLSLLMIILLMGCAINNKPSSANNEIASVNEQETSLYDDAINASSETEVEEPVETEMEESAKTEVEEPVETDTEKQAEEIVATQETIQTPIAELSMLEKMTDKEKNSYSMLYYLFVTTETIRSSRDNRLVLDEIYDTLLNDLNPKTIDETTQEYLQSLRETLKSFRKISVKRERLQFIYNQQAADAMRELIPDPMTFLSISNARDWNQLAASVAYTVIDSHNNYKHATRSAEQQFLTSGWELDDEETDTIFRIRDRAFDYVVNITREYDQEGRLTPNDDFVKTFTTICQIQSVNEKIDRLESKEETYKLLGKYWLELANCYFEVGRNRDGLYCVEKYKELSIDIYRLDRDYARILPKAIVAAQNLYRGEYRIKTIEDFAIDLSKNISDDEWSLRYFLALTYFDLYQDTDNTKYLEDSFREVKTNISCLKGQQKTLNKTYLNKLEKEENPDEPDYRFMSEKERKTAEKEYKEEVKRVKEYNTERENARKTELPPLYEPLVVNCDLLFAVADKIVEEKLLSNADKNLIEEILETKTNGVFLTNPLNDRYSFSENSKKYEISFDGESMIIPAKLLTEDAKILLTVKTNKKSKTFDDFTVVKVERDEKNYIDAFFVQVTSDKIKSYKWEKGLQVTIKIYDYKDKEPLVFKFKVTEFKDNGLFPDKVVFKAQ